MNEHGLTLEVAEELQEEGLGSFGDSFAELLITIRDTADEHDSSGSGERGPHARESRLT